MSDLLKAKEYLKPGAIVPVDIPTTALLVNALRQALANEALDKMAENARELGLAEQPAQQQEPVAYDKTEINCFAQDLYDQKMREGKRGHYESMFHVIHQCIKKVSPPASKPLTDEEIKRMAAPWFLSMYWPLCNTFARAIEAAHGIKGDA